MISKNKTYSDPWYIYIYIFYITENIDISQQARLNLKD